MTELYVLVFCAIFLSLLLLWKGYEYLTEYHDYFKQLGLPFVNPVPVFGSLWGSWKTHIFHEVELERCQTLGSVYGMFWGRMPMVVVSEAALLKRIFIKDFDHFRNHVRIDLNDEYFDRILSSLDDEEWKEMRSISTPIFSTAKIKQLVPAMNDVAETLVRHLKQRPKGMTVNMRIPVTAFVTDVMAICGFGVRTDSMENPNNPFIFNSGTLSAPKDSDSMLYTLGLLYPALKRCMRFFPGAQVDPLKFYSDLTRKLLNERRTEMRDNQIASLHRQDFLSSFLNAEKSDNLLRDERMMVAQLVQFLGFAGLDIPSFTISTVLHCLAMNQDAQAKARDELRRVIGVGRVDYELLSELIYLEQCIWESMRLYPVAARHDRVCTRDIDLGVVKLKRGMSVAVPVYAIHRDPKLYPNPGKFDPDRFSAELKATRDPMNFLPFGHGNRSCIAARFALVKVKVALACLLLNLRFVPTQETQNPPKISFGILGFLSCNDFPLAVEHL